MVKPMEKDENRKELPDEALDAVTGGGVVGGGRTAGSFTKNNCFSCRHYENFKTECPYASPLMAALKFGDASQCPSKEV